MYWMDHSRLLQELQVLTFCRQCLRVKAQGLQLVISGHKPKVTRDPQLHARTSESNMQYLRGNLAHWNPRVDRASNLSNPNQG